MTRETLDNFLIAELKAGNTRAFDKIFNDYYLNLCRYASSIVQDEDKARSLVQNVFVKIWENRLQLENIVNLPPYLTTMVRNESINHLRREKRMVRMDVLPDELHTNTAAEEKFRESEIGERLTLATLSLPDRCREAFEYSRFDDLSNSEIALKMGISVKGVEALITRSLKHLRIELAEFLPSARNKKLPANTLLIIFRKLLHVSKSF
jgi:RNA polymerase sigma-70 factor, ECF subfamily